MTRFRALLRERQTDPAGRLWLFVPYDQLSDAIGPLSREDPRELGIVLVESRGKAGRRPYHRQKLALILANLRHFALEQAARGVAVRHEATEGGYADALARVARELGTLRVMEPAERELREELRSLVERGALEIVPHEGWLTTRAQFERIFAGGRPYRMDTFYRAVRAETGILMEGGRPAGGRLSFDVENRKPWRGRPAAPDAPSFPIDPVKEEVGELVEREFASHPGRLDLAAIPATQDDAEALWRRAREECLAAFGPFEDAMSVRSTGLFHTRVSGLLNLHRLLPSRVIADVAAQDLPIASREGFVRQVLGWREFVRHVHVATDGFRRLPDGTRPALSGGGAAPNLLGAAEPLPPAYWGAPSGFACLDRVIADVWKDGYSHHITRLMVLSNLATLLGVSPRELTDWFWVAYTDAFDWVVEPNVLGMGTFALGPLFTTKPYVSGAAYVNRMSDYCGACAFRPDADCPVTPLYWSFLERNASVLAGNPRLAMPLRSLSKRSDATRRADARVAAWARETLRRGEPLAPENLPVR